MSLDDEVAVGLEEAEVEDSVTVGLGEVDVSVAVAVGLDEVEVSLADVLGVVDGLLLPAEALLIAKSGMAITASTATRAITTGRQERSVAKERIKVLPNCQKNDAISICPNGLSPKPRSELFVYGT